MASIFDDVFVGGEAVKASANPQVALDGFTFTLLSVEPVRPWKDTGEVDEHGKPVRRPVKDEVVTDETGERIQLVLGLQLTDANGRSTSPKALYREKTHFFDHDEAKALVECVKGKGQVRLENARIEFVDSTRDSFIMSTPKLVFDGVTVD